MKGKWTIRSWSKTTGITRAATNSNGGKDESERTRNAADKKQLPARIKDCVAEGEAPSSSPQGVVGGPEEGGRLKEREKNVGTRNFN